MLLSRGFFVFVVGIVVCAAWRSEVCPEVAKLSHSNEVAPLQGTLFSGV